MNNKKKTNSPIDILSFLKEETVEEAEKVNVQPIQSKVLAFIRESGKVTKSNLYKWAKKQKITPAELYKNVKTLQDQNLIKVFFDENSGELVYKAT